MEMETMLSICAAPGQAHRVADVGCGAAGWQARAGRWGGEAERRPPGGERRQAKG